MSKPDYEELARDVFFTGILDLKKYGIEYRKGKTIDDVKNAIIKAGKNGRKKVEYELSMLELYLADIFKKVR